MGIPFLLLVGQGYSSKIGPKYVFPQCKTSIGNGSVNI